MRTTYGKILAAVLAVSTAVPALAAEVDRREAHQQDRIAEGVKSGELTPGETARLERREQKIRGEVRRDRAANGGKLTPAEKAKINRQENRTSRAIYRAKHNDKHM